MRLKNLYTYKNRKIKTSLSKKKNICYPSSKCSNFPKDDSASLEINKKYFVSSPKTFVSRMIIL